MFAVFVLRFSFALIFYQHTVRTMNKAPSTIDTEAIVNEAEQIAIHKAAENQSRISDIAGLQKNALKDVLMRDAKGSDGASSSEDNTPDMTALEAKVEQQARERESRFEDGAKVGALPGNVVGMQMDGSRSITIDTSLVSVHADAAQAEEVMVHELQHTKQESAHDALVDIPKTGNVEVDKMLEVDHLAYRERDAMLAAGDAFTSQQYHEDYKAPVNRVAAFLEKNGQDGEQLVQNAALKGEVAAVQRALLQAHFKKQMNEALNN